MVVHGPLVAAAIFTVYTFLLSWRQVSTGNVALIERGGKYHRTLEPGWHFIAWPLDQVSFCTPVSEILLDVPAQQCFSKDNSPLSVDAVIFLQIIDPVKAFYKVRDIKTAVAQMCLGNLRNQVGSLTLDQCMSGREVISTAICQNLSQTVKDWGVLINRVELQEVKPSNDMVRAMEKEWAAIREKEATRLKSEGERLAQANEADAAAYAVLADAKAQASRQEQMALADANQLRTKAEAIKAAIRTVATAVGESSGTGPSAQSTRTAVEVLLLNRYMEAQQELAKSPNTKVMMFPTKDSLSAFAEDGLLMTIHQDKKRK